MSTIILWYTSPHKNEFTQCVTETEWFSSEGIPNFSTISDWNSCLFEFCSCNLNLFNHLLRIACFFIFLPDSLSSTSCLSSSWYKDLKFSILLFFTFYIFEFAKLKIRLMKYLTAELRRIATWQTHHLRLQIAIGKSCLTLEIILKDPPSF